MTNPIGKKFDSGKPEFSLLPPWALESVAKVLTFGAQKYDVDNWKYVENGEQRYKNAAMRHLNDYMKGEKFDQETGLNHLAHAVCCLMFMLDADESGIPLAKAMGSGTAVKFDVPAVNYVFSSPPTPEPYVDNTFASTPYGQALANWDNKVISLGGMAYPVGKSTVTFSSNIK